MIWLLAALLAVAAVAGIAAPWWWPAFTRRPALPRDRANVVAYRGRLEELEADASAGVVAADALGEARQELAAHLVDDADTPAPPPLRARGSRAVLIVAALALPVFTAAWYALDGSWRTQRLVALSRTDPELARATALDQSIAQLRDEVAARPDSAEAWAWLARSYRARGSHADAAAAFARANALNGAQDPDLLAEEGEALAYTQDRRMAGAPAEKFAAALALAPDHPQALWYAGVAALQAGDDHGAIAHWERLANQELPDELRSTLEHSLAQLRERSGLPAPQAAGAAPAGPVRLTIEVSVAPALAAEIEPGHTLFVYAVDPAGPPMPLAVQRLSAAALPARVTLDDSNSMMPARKLSSVQRWRVVARVSGSGSATPQPGDLEGSIEVDRTSLGKPLRLPIERRRP